MGKIKAPDSLTSIKALYPRALVLGLIGIEYVIFIPLYGVTINACIKTAGEPYAAALAHYKAKHNETRFVDTADEWNMPSWEPEEYDPFAELDKDSGFNTGDEAEGDMIKMEEKEEEKGEKEEEKEEEPERSLPNPFLPNFWCLLAFVGVCLGNALAWFIQRWSIKVRTTLKWTGAPNLHVGAYAYCTPLPHQGAAEIVPVQEVLCDGKEVLYFDFQRMRFEIDPNTQEVTPLRCPVEEPMEKYTSATGMSGEAAVKAAVQRFGTNSLFIPVPTFQEIFLKQILGPVPVFQYLCTLLWLVDQYWNYALFNMFSIGMFEASTAFGRLKNLSTLRGMRNKDQTVKVRRGGKWSDVSTVELVPGDVFSLSKEGREETVVPCDALIIGGGAVVNEATLTGESTPQIKEAASAVGAGAKEALDITGAHRVHTLYSGTSIMQISGEKKDGQLQAPDDGCVCYCLRTGFSSSQGQLVRMIEYSSEQVTGDVKETLALLFLLLVFALMASSYVLRKGLQEGKKSQYELVLRCVLILTSVVPPELPMQTAVAVNTALLALWKSQIFCTEPFRIPYAGRIKVALFDKTGTLTTDQLVCAGTSCFKSALSDPSARPVEAMETTSWEAAAVLGGCHALVKVDGQVAGDPIEVASVRALGWEYNAATATTAPHADKAVKSIPKGASIQVVQRYHFASRLQRMSTVAKVRAGAGSAPETWALVKGSPEAVGRLLVSKPAAYDATYRQMAEEGMRVLALAFRKVPDSELAAAERARPGQPLAREEVEAGLVFAGFIAFTCPVRKDSALIVRELASGAMDVLMATGDAALTALHVGAQVGITEKKNAYRALSLEEEEGGALVWRQARRARSEAEAITDIPYSPAGIPALTKQGYDLCVVGDMLRKAAAASEEVWEHVEHVKIWARMAPDDKERVIRALRERGVHSLMCGDGANDVGALKQAHVGVALLSGFGGANTAKDGEKPLEEESEAEKKARIEGEQQKAKDRSLAMAADRKADAAKLQEMQKKFYEEELHRLEASGESWAPLKAMKTATGRMMEEQKKMLAERRKQYGGGSEGGLAAQAAMMAQDGDTGETPMVKLGDASVAAPFTSKLPSIKSCVDVVRQGRCTLVSTIQMQQILALNCLIAAYSLSALYLDGIRSGEAQMIASGLLLTIASLAFSYAVPVKELSPIHPITTIFHPAISLSIVGQLLIHLYCMVYSINLAKEHSTEEELFELNEDLPPPPPPEPVVQEDGTFGTPFRPTLLNTVVFLIETAQQVSVMAVNYKGRPFMIASTENRPMLYSLAACCAGTFIAAFELIPELNKLLQLVPLPSDEFRLNLLRTLGLSVFGSFIWDRLCVLVFAPRLLIQSHIDAWRALPPLGESLRSSGKILAGATVVGLWLYTSNIGILLCAWYVYRQINKANQPPPAPAPSAAAAPAAPLPSAPARS